MGTTVRTSILTSTIVHGFKLSSIRRGITMIDWFPCLAIRLGLSTVDEHFNYLFCKLSIK